MLRKYVLVVKDKIIEHSGGRFMIMRQADADILNANIKNHSPYPYDRAWIPYCRYLKLKKIREIKNEESR